MRSLEGRALAVAVRGRRAEARTLGGSCAHPPVVELVDPDLAPAGPGRRGAVAAGADSVPQAVGALVGAVVHALPPLAGLLVVGHAVYQPEPREVVVDWSGQPAGSLWTWVTRSRPGGRAHCRRPVAATVRDLVLGSLRVVAKRVEPI
jgi:hypothetical protein